VGLFWHAEHVIVTTLLPVRSVPMAAAGAATSATIAHAMAPVHFDTGPPRHRRLTASNHRVADRRPHLIELL
jgi:hypothetical protein